VLLVPYAIARVFVLDLNSALCGSNWKRPPLIADVKLPFHQQPGAAGRGESLGVTVCACGLPFFAVRFHSFRRLHPSDKIFSYSWLTRGGRSDLLLTKSSPNARQNRNGRQPYAFIRTRAVSILWKRQRLSLACS
jgi:hypothetical protein